MRIRVRAFKISIFVMLVCGLTGFGQSVSATSVYDNVIRSTPDIIIDNPNYTGSKDITESWQSLMMNGGADFLVSSTCTQAIKNSFVNALSTGDLAITQSDNIDDGSGGRRVFVLWREDRTKSAVIGDYLYGDVPAYYLHYASGYHSAQFFQYDNNQYGLTCYDGLGTNIISSPDSGSFNLKVFFSTFTTIYPPGYDGSSVPGAEEQYFDDGIDTDGDGLSDFVESQWNPSRDDIFCDKTATPFICAYPDPAKKDVYVEIDWMNDGTQSFKPTATQVGLVSDAFAAKDIHFHADTGQYGGGSLLSPYTTPLTMVKDPLVTDFFDFKDASFSTSRKGIWRYMISGKNFASSPTSSGASFAGSDNIFVSNGLIRENQSSFGYTDLDTAIAGTMLHEIGHSLCLSADARYSYQNSACIFGGVDSGDATTNSYPLYNSSMNYYHQMGMVDYSAKPNLIGDHDDWSAIKSYTGDFTSWDYDTELSSGAGMLSRTAKSRLSVAITTETAKELRKKGLLKPGKATWRHLEVKRGVK